ncbi:MAG: polyprenyl synthetase family protein [Dysgonamonadaceae bacterium]|nr:polyprenyl synthetase family protein [Dysgonamonadaceae bacterium]MDD3356762.1 polyprenyl synthetase family protein [Dysgonamonadaceae bacterium]MDD3728177.1 polyprenyl synthetase family protein [Dysgonamonadaceae bacterium]MDD4247090.1 polyprenyl synthetase family protein [Dysgonamonadaceae bacterium]MDD4604713.1 polyprenyl synthetase family protein [Dysgonamonadaceae bacterium]
MYTSAELENKINLAIAELNFKNEPNSLFAPIKYILSLGGKRLRPILAYMATNLFSDDIEKTTSPAIAIEMFHNFSLLHDDLMDNASLRRGQPTVHLKWNASTAVLSGDAMLIDAYNYISKVPENVLSDILKVFTTTAMQVCEGQQFDMDFEQRLNVKEFEYIEMIRLKTAVLLAASLKIGALLGGASKKDVEQLYDFGINIGLAFQLKDDLLDVYGDTQSFGKEIGGDILSNKKTFLLIKALENSNEKDNATLQKWISAKNFDTDAKINAVKKIYDELNLDFITNKLIQKYYLAGLKCLSEVDVSEDRKRELLIYTNNLMNREK